MPISWPPVVPTTSVRAMAYSWPWVVGFWATTLVIGCNADEQRRPVQGGGGASSSSSTTGGGDGGDGPAACVDLTGLWGLEGDCPVGECAFQQIGECAFQGSCEPLVGLVVSGEATGHAFSFEVAGVTCEGTADDAGTTITGTCSNDCSFTATRGPAMHEGWGCYIVDLPEACVCDFESYGSGSVEPNALACPAMTCCRTFNHRGATRCGCWETEEQCQLADDNLDAQEVSQCPPP